MFDDFVRVPTYADTSRTIAYVAFGAGILAVIIGFVVQSESVAKGDKNTKKVGWYSAAGGIWLLSIAAAVIFTMNSACGPTSPTLMPDMAGGGYGGGMDHYGGGYEGAY